MPHYYPRVIVTFDDPSPLSVGTTGTIGVGYATFLIEVGADTDGFHPTNATAHANAVLPGQLFMMFSAVDKSFSAKPTFRFRKP